MQIGHCLSRGVNRHGPPFPGKAAQIIETHDVIGMRVGKNNGVNATDIFPQGLCPKVRSGIDKKAISGVSI
jgi:hypothetical protein